MKPSTQDIFDCMVKTYQWLKKHPWMVDKDRENDAIKTIKCLGDHIGDPEASKILCYFRSVQCIK